MKCHFCGLLHNQTVRVNGGGLVRVKVGTTKEGDNICGFCRFKLLRNQQTARRSTRDAGWVCGDVD